MKVNKANTTKVVEKWAEAILTGNKSGLITQTYVNDMLVDTNPDDRLTEYGYAIHAVKAAVDDKDFKNNLMSKFRVQSVRAAEFHKLDVKPSVKLVPKTKGTLCVEWSRIVPRDTSQDAVLAACRQWLTNPNSAEYETALTDAKIAYTKLINSINDKQQAQQAIVNASDTANDPDSGQDAGFAELETDTIDADELPTAVAV